MKKNKEKPITTWSGANQWVTDPRAQLFLAYYRDPKSPTFSNARASALKATYSEEYADNIMSLMPDWLSDVIGKPSPMLMKAERNLEEALDLPSMTQAMGAFGPIYEKVGKGKGARKKPVMTYNKGLMALKIDASKFVAETVGKKKYSKKDGGEGNTYNVVIFANEQRKKIARRIIGGGSGGHTEG